MDPAHDRLITWIKDAYGMEQSQLKMLDQFIADFHDEESICSQLKQHKTVTEHQCQQLSECLERFEESPSGLKAAVGSAMGMMQGMSTSLSKDEKIKNMVIIYAGENFEYGTYQAIQAAAEELDEAGIARMAKEIGEQEQAAASWALQQIPVLARKQVGA
jgi:ferritin-like metal-binding protein YciE